MVEQAPLGLLAPHDPRGHEGEQGREPPSAGMLVEGPQDGLGEGVAHDGDGVHVVGVDGVEELDGVEAATGERHDASAHGHGRHGGEPPRAVHEWTGGEVERSRPHDGLADTVGAPVLGHPQEVAGVELGEEVVLAPHDPLGHPRRAAGVEEVHVVARAGPRSGGTRRGALAPRPRRASPTTGTGRCRRPPTTRPGRAARGSSIRRCAARRHRGR